MVDSQWMGRTESVSGSKDKKLYVPQVVDSLVYLSRTHYDTLRKFAETVEPLWRNFTRNHSKAWMRCEMKDVRYRFPDEQYYKKRMCTSVSEILTLEVTGITDTSQTREEFPWTKTFFHSVCTAIRARNSESVMVFEVSVFQHDEQFILKDELFLWRIRTLEDTLRKHQGSHEEGGVPSYYFFVNSNTSDDNISMELVQCKIIKIKENATEITTQELHFKRCGY